MRIVIISDTHGHEASLGVLAGDVLIHCGDVMSGSGRSDDALDRLDDWFSRQHFSEILCIGGNHDRALQARTFTDGPVLRHARYLQDDLAIIDGVRFYGAPWVPMLRGSAYYCSGPELKRRWDAVPADVDVLITHTPPEGILDCNRTGMSLGCRALAAALPRIRPRLHCFGHVHASRGKVRLDGTQYINAAQLSHASRGLRAPMVVTFPC